MGVGGEYEKDDTGTYGYGVALNPKPKPRGNIVQTQGPRQGDSSKLPP